MLPMPLRIWSQPASIRLTCNAQRHMDDFPTAFVAFRARLEAGQDSAFQSHENIEIAGRPAALLSTFESRHKRTLLGMIPTDRFGHAHEYRMLFAAPGLNETALADWWQYAQNAADRLVVPDDTHEFSIVSLLLVTDSLPRSVSKKLRRLSAEQDFGRNGWSSLRMAVIDLSARMIYTNRVGEPLKTVLRPFLLL